MWKMCGLPEETTDHHDVKMLGANHIKLVTLEYINDLIMTVEPQIS